MMKLLREWLCILGTILPLIIQGETFPDNSNAIQPECSHQLYKVHIFSRHPLVIYIEDFVSADEASRLKNQAEPLYAPSKVYNADNATGQASEGLDNSHRSSYSTILPDDGPGSLTHCITKRAATFQGLPIGNLEALQVVRYELNGYFNEHWDWFSHVGSCIGYHCDHMGDRLSTFFVYLEANCTGGETRFPKMRLPDGMVGEWCEFVDCEEGSAGVSWKPRVGNAVYWENLGGDGKGILETLHAGMPVKEGSKIGLNIWTRERVNDELIGKENEKSAGGGKSEEPSVHSFADRSGEL